MTASSVHQILFGWSERSLTGNRGVGPVATSLGPDELDLWETRLRDRIWATARPAAGIELVHLRFDDGACVLRKMRATDGLGRDNSTLAHALIGSGFDARTALGLERWDGWLGVPDLAVPDPDGPAVDLPRLAAEALYEAAGLGLDDLRIRARRLRPAPLVELVGWLLSHPMADASIVDSPAPPAELLCGLLDILDPATSSGWSFSTGEDNDAGADQPRVVFLVGPPEFSMHRSKRARLRLTEHAEDTDPDLYAFASALVRSYQVRGGAVLDLLRPDRPPTAADEALVWAAAVQLLPGQLLDVVDLVGQASQGVWMPAVEAALATDRATHVIDADLTRLPDPELGALVDQLWSADAKPDQQYPALAGLLQWALARRVVAAGAGSELRETMIDVTPPQAVADLIMHWWGDRVVQPFGMQDLYELADRILGFELSQAGRWQVLAHTVGQVEASWLLGWVDCYAGRWPAHAGLILEHVLDRGEAGLDRAATVTLLSRRGLLCEAVGEVSQGPGAAAGLLERLLRLAYGAALDTPALTALLRGPLTPALIYACYRAARDPAQRRRVEQAATRCLFAGHGFDASAATVAPDDESGLTAPVDAGPAGPGNPTGPGAAGCVDHDPAAAGPAPVADPVGDAVATEQPAETHIDGVEGAEPPDDPSRTGGRIRRATQRFRGGRP